MLKHFLVIAGIAALAWAAIAQAHAQPYRGGGRGPSATLYDRPNFEGRQVTITGEVTNLSNYGFNDRAHSLRLQGRWRLCEHSDFGGRCVELSGEVPELNTMALAERITSLEPIGGGGRPDRPWPGPGGGYGRGERGVEGHNAVFFPRPTVRGLDVAAGSNGANVFCREQGLGGALYFDSSQRAGRAIGPEGQMVGPSPVLRDLLCRRP